MLLTSCYYVGNSPGLCSSSMFGIAQSWVIHYQLLRGCTPHRRRLRLPRKLSPCRTGSRTGAGMGELDWTRNGHLQPFHLGKIIFFLRAMPKTWKRRRMGVGEKVRPIYHGLTGHLHILWTSNLSWGTQIWPTVNSGHRFCFLPVSNFICSSTKSTPSYDGYPHIFIIWSTHGNTTVVSSTSHQISLAQRSPATLCSRERCDRVVRHGPPLVRGCSLRFGSKTHVYKMVAPNTFWNLLNMVSGFMGIILRIGLKENRTGNLISGA